MHILGRLEILASLRISAINAANILAVMGGMSIAGRLIMGSTSDRIGNKPALIIGFSLASVALLWLQLAGEVWMLYLFAAIFGFTYGGLITLLSPIIAELFGLGSHGIIMGVVVFCNTIGCAIGPVMAGYIFDITGSYQLAFWVCAAAGITSLTLTLLLRPASNKETLDFL